jgi:polar amino acid transport system permease protein
MGQSVEIILSHSRLLINGLVLTLQLSAVVVIIGSLIGIAGGLALSYGPLPLRLAIRGYVDLLRGLPLLVTIFIIFYGLPVALQLEIEPFEAVATALSVFAGAHMTEIVRGAVTSIPRTQTDAAKAIGLTFLPRMRYVILPQAWRRALPPWVNLGADLVKGTSLASLVSLSDLMLSTNKVIESTQEPIPFYIVTGIIYFVICFSLSRLAALIGRNPRWGF